MITSETKAAPLSKAAQTLLRLIRELQIDGRPRACPSRRQLAAYRDQHPGVTEQELAAVAWWKPHWLPVRFDLVPQFLLWAEVRLGFEDEVRLLEQRTPGPQNHFPSLDRLMATLTELKTHGVVERSEVVWQRLSNLVGGGGVEYVRPDGEHIEIRGIVLGGGAHGFEVHVGDPPGAYLWGRQFPCWELAWSLAPGWAEALMEEKEIEEPNAKKPVERWSVPMTGAEIARRFLAKDVARWSEVEPILRRSGYEREPEARKISIRLDSLDADAQERIRTVRGKKTISSG